MAVQLVEWAGVAEAAAGGATDPAAGKVAVGLPAAGFHSAWPPRRGRHGDGVGV